ncbi:MAG TPA: hypothetical protein VFL83_07085 [Anaeromyxobacter sp.]|nr:hypothetical protein [Anaeromyxobacter sp.]
MRGGTCSTLFAAVLLAACGDDSSGTQGNVCTPGTRTTVTVTATGVTKATCLLPGGTVTFRNSDAAAAHSIQNTSGLAACNALNLGPIAAAGGSVDATLPSAAACAFAESAHANDPAFQGTVFVMTAPAGGPGH